MLSLLSIEVFSTKPSANILGNAVGHLNTLAQTGSPDVATSNGRLAMPRASQPGWTSFVLQILGTAFGCRVVIMVVINLSRLTSGPWQLLCSSQCLLILLPLVSWRGCCSYYCVHCCRSLRLRHCPTASSPAQQKLFHATLQLATSHGQYWSPVSLQSLAQAALCCGPISEAA